MIIMRVKISEIRDNPKLNKIVDEDSKIFRALVESIKKLGVVEPVTLDEHMDDFTMESFFTVIDGVHRVQAAKELGILEIPALVKVTHINQV
jgi:ParB-like chromosome segregation protein Spo0J